MPGLRLTGWGVGLPDRVVTNDELSLSLETSDEWIAERTGIRERRVGGSASTLGLAAARAALDVANVEPAAIDAILLATTTPDRLIPATAPLIQEALGAQCPAVDLNAACSGFMYGLWLGRGLLATGSKRILLIGAEHLSRWVDWDDRAMAVLFGDGAGAVVLESTEDDGDLLGFDVGSDGSLMRLISCEHGGTIQMDGKETFRRAVRIMVDSAQRALKEASLSIEDVSLVVPHQANQRIIQAACDRLGVNVDRAVSVIDRYGNTSSASIPLALVDALSEGRVKPGDVLLLTGFGAGMTWASAVLRWPG
ncbi:MAG TPA: beta-ketoacyl-ACP synthase III [Acidimicrobiales bacterium]|nr:beta-ketoacyl-ACP synthase III [Acidimicrobiales bacterium]